MADARMNIRVRYHEVDQMGFVYHPRYLSWFEMGRMTLLRGLGHPYDRLEAGGILLPVVRAEVDYLLPLGFDQVFELELELTDLGRASMTLDYRLRLDDTLHTRGRTRHACLDAVSRRPTRLPAGLVEAFTRLPSQGGDHPVLESRDPAEVELIR